MGCSSVVSSDVLFFVFIFKAKRKRIILIFSSLRFTVI